MNKYTAVTEHWRIPTLPMCLWKTRVGIHRWLLSCQLKSPKNPVFAGFYYQTLGDSSEKTVGIRLVDSFLKLCSYLYWFGLQVHKGWYRYGLGKSSQLYREEPNGSKQQIFTFAVGNYTWGGTGKTPFVLYLSKLLVSRGYQPVILSRGYGHKDEAKMMTKQGLAVITGSNREAAFQQAVSSLPSWSSIIVILDDGLQHWRLKRQANVLMVNTARAFGINGHLIPRGSLRECPREAASRCTCIVLHHCNLVSNIQLQQLKDWFQTYCPETPILTSSMVARSLYVSSPDGTLRKRPWNALANTDAVLCCGIEYPSGFRQTVLDYCHLRKVYMECREDHHWFPLQELVEIVRKWNGYLEAWNLIVTEKDYYRNEKVFQQLVQDREMKGHVYVVQAELQVHSGLYRLEKLLDELGLLQRKKHI